MSTPSVIWFKGDYVVLPPAQWLVPLPGTSHAETGQLLFLICRAAPLNGCQLAVSPKLGGKIW